MSRAARFAPLAAEVIDDPFPEYARLRAAGRVCRAGPGMWAITRYADVAALLHDPRLGHRFPEAFRTPFAGADGPANALLGAIVSSLDPPAHPRVRQVLRKAMSPEIVRGLRRHIEAEAERMIKAGLAGGGLDAAAELSLPLQVSVGAELIGLPEELREEAWRHGMALGRAFIPFAPEAGDEAEDESVRWLRARVGELVERRRARPGDDLVSRLVAAGTLSDDELIDNTIFLFFAGFETSMYLVAQLGALLAGHEGWKRLRADRSLIPTAVEEVLRYDAPIQWMARIALEPLEIDGVTVKPGRVVLLLLGSANRDGDQYPDPDRLDVGRRAGAHLSFGGGPHRCLGVTLARAQGAAVLEKLLDHCSELRPAGSPVRRPHPNLRGYDSVPLELVP